MKKLSFISRLATSTVAVALTLGSFVFVSCEDDPEIIAEPLTRLDVPVVAPEVTADETSLTFSWGTVAEATSYSAQIRLSDSGDIFREQITSNTSVTFNGLTDGTEYYFRVRANYEYNESRNSAYSEYRVVSTVQSDPSIPALAMPENVYCDSSKTTLENGQVSVTFVWDSVENAKEYDVLLTSIGLEDNTASTSETSKTYTGLEMGRQYFFQVRAREVLNGSTVVYKSSPYTGAINVTTIAQLQTPQNLQNTQKMAQAAKFEWDAVEGAVNYYYEMTTLNTSGSEVTVMEGLITELSDELIPGETISATSTNTSMTWRGLDKATYYAFRVKAMAPAGSSTLVDSEFTDYFVIRTLETDATPLATPVVTLEKQQLKVIATWASVANAAGYEYEFTDGATTSTGKVSADEETGNIPTTVTISKIGSGDDAVALTPSTKYQFRLRALASPENKTDDNSVWTDWLDATTAALATELTMDPEAALAEEIARMAPGGVLTVPAGNYATTGTVNFTNGLTIKAAEGATVVIDLAKGSFSWPAEAKIADPIVFEGLTLIGKNSAGSGDHIVNGPNAASSVQEIKFVNCVAKDFDRSFVRTQGATTLNAVTIEDCTISWVAGCSQTYDLVQLNQAVETVTIKNSTFVSLSAFVRVNAGSAGVATIENCSFVDTRSGGQMFRVNSGFSGTFANNVLSGALTNAGNNDASAAALTASNNFIASDMSLSRNFTAAPTKESLTGAELFPKASEGNYAVAAGSQAAAAGAGDQRWK